MALFVWPQPMEPDFPLAVLEYQSAAHGDPMHWHDYLEIATVLEGHGAFRFGRRSLPAEPGDVFFIDNVQPHVAVADPGAPLRLLLVLFRPELIAGSGCRDLDEGYLAPFRTDRTGSPRICGTAPLAVELGPILRELETTWDRHDPAERHLVDATLRRALALVNRERGHATVAEARAAADRRQQIRPVLAYLDHHWGESVTLGDVAELVHVSPSRARHVFRDATGVSFKDYLTQVRVTEAKRLLLSTDLAVSEVAAAVSYTNLNQFYRVFYRSSSMSPGEYRRYYTAADAEPLVAGSYPDGAGSMVSIPAYQAPQAVTSPAMQPRTATIQRPRASGSRNPNS